MVVINFSIEHEDIDTMIDKMDNLISEHFTIFSNFVKDAKDSDNWFAKFLASVAAAFQQAINITLIGFKILLLITGNLIRFPYNIWQSNSYHILKIIGYIGYFSLTWYNIRIIMDVYSYIKGASK